MTRTKSTRSSGNVYADLGFPSPEEHAKWTPLPGRIAPTEPVAVHYGYRLLHPTDCRQIYLRADANPLRRSA